jgi:16S rRNA (guanine966-N2)-methyltransferase
MTTKQSNSVRIIGGKYRGRRLTFPDLPGLRPTPDRVRETLFNWLMHDIHGACVLDLFAGSGALGVEALSRGASHVTFVEKDSKASRIIRENLDYLKALSSHYEVHQADALIYLASLSALTACNAKFDLIFLDPPFGKDLLAQCLPACFACLKPGGKIYIEQESSLLPESYLPKSLFENLSVLKEKIAGEVRYLLINCG